MASQDKAATELTESKGATFAEQVGAWATAAFLPGGNLRPAGEYRDEVPASKGLKVIDVDSHLSEPGDLWTSALPASQRDRAPRLGMRDGLEFWIIGDEPVGMSVASVINDDGDKMLGRFGTHSRAVAHPAAFDVDDRVEMLDKLGIWAQICYPNSFANASITLLKWYEPDFAEELIRIFNDYCADAQSRSGGRLLPLPLLPVWDSKAMEKEALRCHELGLKGFNLPDRPEQFGVPSMIDDHWAPLFEISNSTGMPINFHIITGGIDGMSLTWDGFSLDRKLAVGSMLFYVGNAATLGNFIVSGLLDKYPKMKMVSVESGVGWIPFVIEALEYQVDEMMPDSDLQRRPTEYFRDQIYSSFWFEHRGLEHAIELLGTSDNIMFETDFPHPTSLYPDPQGQIELAVGHFEYDIRRKLLQDNAARCYNIEL